jgi:hypothetical protein
MATVTKTTHWVSKHPRTGLDWNRSNTEDLFTGSRKDCLTKIQEFAKETGIVISVNCPNFIRLENNTTFDIYD